MYPVIKRISDFSVALVLIVITLPIQVFLLVGSSISTRSCGLFFQNRIGYRNRNFVLVKYKSMRDTGTITDFQTSLLDSRITTWGKFIRRSKLDELPQLYNVLLGSMSFVGPRPDISGYAEKLPEKSQYLNMVRPGITSPASLFFKDEEILLSKVGGKKRYNDTVIWPIKAKMNKEYSDNVSFMVDFLCLLQTINLKSHSRFTEDKVA